MEQNTVTLIFSQTMMLDKVEYAGKRKWSVSILIGRVLSWSGFFHTEGLDKLDIKFCFLPHTNKSITNVLQTYLTQGILWIVTWQGLFRWPITKINQSDCSIAGPIFSKTQTELFLEWLVTLRNQSWRFLSSFSECVINLLFKPSLLRTAGEYPIPL